MRFDLPNHCFAIAELHENGLSVAFKIFNQFDDELPGTDPEWIGFVKWDGCSNWLPGGPGGEPAYAHFCDEEDERAFGEMLVTLRWHALEMMGAKASFAMDLPRDLGQEAKDREEMIQLLLDTHPEQTHQHVGMKCWHCIARALLKRLGRLP